VRSKADISQLNLLHGSVLLIVGLSLTAWVLLVFRKKKKDVDADVDQETARVVGDVQSEEDTQLKRRHVEFYYR